MTFAEFQSSAKSIADLREVETARDCFDGASRAVPGIVYAGDVWVECAGAKFVLTLANTQYDSYDRAEIERELYDYAMRERLI